jgi:phosphohistidine swiveling domain-containing protein
MFLDRPLPGFAPLLWRASALVCRGGGAAAHLFEVAGSLGVPTVVGEVDAAPGQLVSVDGAGSVWTA